MKRLALTTVLAAAIAAPAIADEAKGEVLAFDRVAGILVLTDKTVWSLESLLTDLRPDLFAGDKVHIEYESAGEDGMTEITALHKVTG